MCSNHMGVDISFGTISASFCIISDWYEVWKVLLFELRG
jgi:hypothetical protein